MGDHSKVSPLKNFFGGGVGGMCLVFTGHPFDTIKVRLQTMAKAPNAVTTGVQVTTGYNGAFDCFKRTFVTEGIAGFYKGMGTPLVMVTPLFAIGFFGYGTGKQLISYATNQPADKLLSPLQLFYAGAFSGGISAVIVAPVERIKCLLQVQVQEGASVVKKYKGPTSCATALLKEGGVPSLYKGFGATCLRQIPQAGLYFMSYDCLKRYFMARDNSTSLGPGMTLLAGGLTGIINWTLVLPLDVIKNRVQTAPKGLYPRGIRDALPQLLRTEGPRGLFLGVIPVFLRAFPANAACFMGFETAIKVLNWAAPDY